MELGRGAACWAGEERVVHFDCVQGCRDEAEGVLRVGEGIDVCEARDVGVKADLEAGFLAVAGGHGANAHGELGEAFPFGEFVG